MGSFDELIREEIVKKKLPPKVVAVPGAADYALRRSVFGDLAVMSAVIEIVEISRGGIVWAGSASQQAGAWRWSRDAV